MRSLRNTGSSASRLVIATAATGLPLPPVDFAAVPEGWYGDFGGAVIPEFELELWATEAIAVTNAIMYGATQQPVTYASVTVEAALVVADFVFTAVATTDVLSKVAHTLRTGDGPFRVSNAGGALPAGLAAATDYWAIKIDADTFYLASSRANALGNVRINITTNGTGVQTLADVAGTKRVADPADAGTNAIAFVAHGFKTGDGPITLSTIAGLPAPLAVETDYYAIRVDADHFKLATSVANALSGTAIDITTPGSDVTIAAANNTLLRLWWSTHDSLLGVAGDGAITLTDTLMYRKRIPHSPRVVGYALAATLDTGAVSVALFPVVDR